MKAGTRILAARWRWRRGDVRNAIVVLVVAGFYSCAVGFYQRSAHQFAHALEALDSRDWERLQYLRIVSPHSKEQEALHALFAAALMLQHGDPHAALRELRYAKGDTATLTRSLVVAGEARYAKNRFREAESYFQNAVKIDPDFAGAHRWLAVMYYDIGLMDQVIEHLQRVAELDLRDPRPHRVMGVIHMDRHGPAIAVEDFEESLRRDPQQPDREEMLLEMAEAQLALNRFDDVLNTVAHLPVSADVLAMQAESFYSLGEEVRARDLAVKALELAPGQRLAIRVLGKLAIDDRHYEEAVEILSAGVKQEPTDYDLRYTLLTAMRAAGRVKEAEEQSQVVEQLRRLRESFNDLLEEAVTQPYNANLRYELGMLARQLNMPRFAETWFRAAVALDAGHNLARAELGQDGSISSNGASLLRGT